MPQVSSGNADLVQQIMYLAQILGQKKDKQAKNILDLALPGQTAGEIGLTGSLGKRALGRNLRPDEVVRPDTPEAAKDRMELKFLHAVASNPDALDQAKPGDVLSLGSTVFANRSAGIPGMTTPQALKTQAKTAETTATTTSVIRKSVLDRVIEGIDSMNKADPATRAAAGQNLAFGTTQEQTAADRFKALLAAEATKKGIQFIADPVNHPLGREFRKLGVDPIAAVAAIGTGSLNFLDNVARLAVSEAEARGATNTALRSAQAQWATRLSESLGNKFSPALIMQVMDRRMSGTPPPKDAKQAGALAEVERIIDQGMEMAYRVAITKAATEGDPNVMALTDRIQSSINIKDETRFQAVATEIRQRTGRIMMAQLVGPRPLEPGPEQQKWDQVADVLAGLGPSVENKGWLSTIKNFVVPDFMRPGGKMGGILGGTPGQPATGPGQQAPTSGPVPTPGPGLPSSINDLPDADKQALMVFMQALGIGQGQPPAGAPAGSPPPTQ